MRRRTNRLLTSLVTLALLLAACGGDGSTADDPPADQDAAADGGVDGSDDEVPADGPEIIVSSFNFPESTILAEIYAQVLEDAGYPVGRNLDLGARELIYPELTGGGIGLLPEYLGSALVVGFDEDPPVDVAAGRDQLQAAFQEDGVTVLQPAPAENANTFVTSAELAEEHGIEAVGDLAELAGVTFAGPPECETRETCFVGLTETYGLDVEFRSIQEPAARLAALQAGDVDLILLFSTDAVLADDSLVALDEPEGIVPPENIVPVVRSEVVDAYDGLGALLDDVSGRLTTEVLIELNRRASEGIAPDEIAGEWLADEGLVG